MNSTQQRGSTVLEALIAFSVLAISALAVMRLQTDLRHDASLSQQQLQASHLAQQHIEQWRAKPSLASEITLSVYNDAATQYRIKRQITQRSAPSLTEISVWVEWKDIRQQTQLWQLHSLQSTVNATYSGALALHQ
jgi:Tfp pilus assembly protein PilV